jgi:sigma-B regulation protein RsbU (phosphoserine phosphatase)
LSNAAEHAEGLSRYIEVHRPDSPESITRHISALLTDYPNITGSAVIFRTGMFPGRSGRFAPFLYRNKDNPEEILYKDLTDHDFSTEEWYAKPKETGRACWTEPYFDEGGAGVLMCTYSVPIFFDDKLAGMATIDMKLDDIHKAMRNIMDRDTKDKRGILFSAAGTIITAPNPERDMKETIHTLADKFHTDAFKQAGESIADTKSDSRNKHYYIDGPISGKHSILVCAPLEDTG